MIIPFPSRRLILTGTTSLVSLVYKYDEIPLSATGTFSLNEAIDIIYLYCPAAFRRAVRNSGGKFLYRGENSILVPTIVSPEPDLLMPTTYDDVEALEYFKCLEESLVSTVETNKIRARPSNGHIGTSDKADAEPWGSPVSIWPLGSSISYVWPRNRKLLYPNRCDDDHNIVIDKDLSDALVLGKEVLFATNSLSSVYRESSFMAIPAIDDAIIRGNLERRRYGVSW